MEKVYAFFAVIGHYRDIAREALRLEKASPPKPKLKRQELEFRPAVEEVTETPPSPLGRIILFTISVFFLIAIAWANIGEMDVIATAQGKIIPVGKVKSVQPSESGTVIAINVHDGKPVKVGDVLIELNPTGAVADDTRLAQELAVERIAIARLEALLQSDPMTSFFPPEFNSTDFSSRESYDEQIASALRHLEDAARARSAKLEGNDNEITQRRAEIRTTKVTIRGLEKRLPILRKRVDSSRSLLEKGFTPRNTHLLLEEELIDLEQQLASAKSRLDEQQAALRTATNRRDQFISEERNDTQNQLSKHKIRAATLNQDLIKARDRTRHQTIVSTVNGVVQQLAVHTKNAFVTQGQELMIIVPDTNQIEIEAMLPNKDKGFVHEGQEAEVKVESFPFTKYGTLRADVKTVSRDAIIDEQLGSVYPIRINMWETEIISGDKFVPLTLGMAVTVEIKTGKRKPIEYILAPFQEYQDESLRER